MRTSTRRNPFPPAALPGYQQPPPGYRCRWIWHPEALSGQAAVVVFRLPFSVDAASQTTIHVTADQRYELHLDGQRLGRGPMRGDLGHWQYESYDLTLEPGSHLLAACVWWLPEDGAPMAQLYGDPGFLLLAEGPLTDTLSTGAAPWVASCIEAYGKAGTGLPGAYQVVGWSFSLDGHRYPWGWADAPAPQGNWQPAVDVAMPIGQGFHPAADVETSQRRPQHHLEPTPLPAMIEVTRTGGTVRYAEAVTGNESVAGQSHVLPRIAMDRNDTKLAARFQGLLTQGTPLTVGSHQQIHVLIDLDDYYCAYPELIASGGDNATLSLGWSEGLYEGTDWHDHRKGNRSAVDGKVVRCLYDRFLLEGGAKRTYTTLWWRSGRYLDLHVETQDDPLTLDGLSWRETRYPLEMEASLETDDAAFDAVRPLMFRTLQMCAHETYMDCPYYEQLQYGGDTRLEILATYLSTHDDRLPVRAATLFDQSRGPDGLTRSRYPSAVPQVIPPFSLWWVAIVYDLYMWRRRAETVRGMLPGIHAVLSAFEQRLSPDDLVMAPEGWNFVDWVPEWTAGWPPDARFGASAILNLQYVYSLDRAIYLYRHLGQPDIARHWSGVRQRVAAAVARNYWVARRGLVADDLAARHFSEHAQCLALLCNLFEGDDRRRLTESLLTAPDLARTTVYFSHYLFEALYHVGALAEADGRLQFWRSLPDMGLKTVLEQPEPSRSDCHAWGAHPLYHAYASFLGARPSEPGLSSIRIAPQPGPFKVMRGRFPDAVSGYVSFDLSFAECLAGTITLPEAMQGELIWKGASVTLRPGTNTVALR